jgi:type VI secretion system secreted protein VgrG
MTSYTQTDRPMRVKTALGDDELLLERFTGDEKLSAPYRFTLDLLSRNEAVSPAKLLRTPVTITMLLVDESERELSGIISRFTQRGQVGDLTEYRAEVVPWVWFLSQSSDCRIFQGLTVPLIVEQVFKDLGFSDFKFKTKKEYPKREYCVQYRETHLDFVSRLLEEEGIFYFFEHTGGKHTMVLADTPSFAEYPKGPKFARVATGGQNKLDEDAVFDCEWSHAACSGKVTLRDYYYMKPTLGLEVSVPGEQKGELYDYPGKYNARSDGDRYARLRMEEREVPHLTLEGRSLCRQFVTGFRFDLKEHGAEAANQPYVLVELSHDAQIGDYRAAGGQPFTYENRFLAIPHNVPYRPPLRTPKPIVHGSQTAVVVGKAGEEIWVDPNGRVKVQFHWDRKGKKDQDSSCWVRVASTWAGKQWGFVQNPRIGQEVIVDFLEGDPDLPIITGRVYNADNMPPYTLPDNQTQTGIKSRSSKGGGSDNFNEIRFEDLKGSEELYLHAEKDEKHVVEHDRADSVGNDESVSIGNDQRLSVGNDRKRTVGNDEEVSIGKQRSTTIGKSESITIGESRSVTIGKNDSRTVSENSSESIGKNATISITENRTTTVGKNETIEVNKKMMVTVADEVTLKSGDASITMKKNGDITIKGKNITIEGSGKINIKASSDVAIKGSKVTNN